MMVHRVPVRCFALLLFAVFAAPAATTNLVWLTDLDVTRVKQTFGKPHADTSMGNNALRVGGVGYARGLGTHADSQFHIDLKSSAVRFTAMPGIDDEVRGNSASLRFTIIGDGQVLWRSPVLISGRQPKPVDLDLTGVKHLSLLVDRVDGSDFYDHADWAEAKLYMLDGAKPEALEKVPPANEAEMRRTFEAGRRKQP